MEDGGAGWKFADAKRNIQSMLGVLHPPLPFAIFDPPSSILVLFSHPFHPWLFNLDFGVWSLIPLC
jgi:hypothetical protein